MENIQLAAIVSAPAAASNTVKQQPVPALTDLPSTSSTGRLCDRCAKTISVRRTLDSAGNTVRL